MQETTQKIPKFIKVRGCHNCETFKIQRDTTRSECECINSGCDNYGINLIKHPFIDPEDVAEEWQQVFCFNKACGKVMFECKHDTDGPYWWMTGSWTTPIDCGNHSL